MRFDLQDNAGRGRRATVFAATTVALVFAGSSALAAETDNNVIGGQDGGKQIVERHVEGELIIKFDRVPTDEFLTEVQQQFPQIQSWRALQHAPHYKNRPGVPHPLAYYRVANIPVDIDDLALASVLEDSQSVISAQRNAIVEMAFVPNDPLYNQQYGPQIIESEDAWDISQGSSSVVVAVTDTGMNFGHEDLSHAIWENTDDPVNGLDDDNNGFVDDWRGWDFNGNDNDCTDGNGHGSHVGGTIAAGLSNSKGIAGMSNSTLMAVQIWSSGGSGTYEDMAEGLYYAVDNGATLVNTSGGGPTNIEMYEDAATYAWDNGVAQVAAAHNWNSNVHCYPAAYPEVVSVAATDSNDQRAYFSNYGDWITVSAPGVDVLSCYRGASDAYTELSGTSMASPHVAGLVALMLTVDPNMSMQNVFDYLQDNAVDLGDPGFDVYYGWGRIDAYATLNAIGPSDCLSMSVTTLNAGNDATWTIGGASAFASGVVVWGTNAGSSVFNNAAGYCASFGIDGVTAQRVVRHWTADGSGDAVVTRRIPANSSGIQVLTQAAERDTCPNECMSNIDTQTVQ